MKRAMKKLLSIIVMLCVCIGMFAQATDLVIDNQTPGWLSSKINYGDQLTVKNLKVTGYINSVDLGFIGSLISTKSLNEKLDLSEVRYIGGGDTSTTGHYDIDDAIYYKYWNTSSGSLSVLLLPILKYPSTNYTPIPPKLNIDTLYVNKPHTKTRPLYNTYGSHAGIVNNLILHEDIDSIPKGTYIGDNVLSIHFSPKTRYIGNEIYFDNNCKLQKVNFKDLDDIEYIEQAAFVWFKPDSLYVPKGLNVFSKAWLIWNYESTNTEPFKDGEHIFISNNTKELECVTSKKVYFHMESSEPPTGTAFGNNVTVYVPAGAGDAYRNSSCWQNTTIIETETSDIEDIIVSGIENTDIYSINGIKVRTNRHNNNDLPKGIYIINGKKVVMK